MVKVVSGVGGGRFPNCTLGGANSSCAGVSEFWVILFGAIRDASDSSVDGVAFVKNVGGVKVASGVLGYVFTAVSTGSSMSAFFGAVVVVVLFMLEAVSTAEAAIGSKSTLSLSVGTLVAHFFYGIGATVIENRFLS